MPGDSYAYQQAGLLGSAGMKSYEQLYRPLDNINNENLNLKSEDQYRYRQLHLKAPMPLVPRSATKVKLSAISPIA